MLRIIFFFSASSMRNTITRISAKEVNLRACSVFATFGHVYYICAVKRAASIILLTVFLFNIVGYYAAFSLLTAANREGMSALLRNKGALETIYIHKEELKNVVFSEDGKELLIHGNMYDVEDLTRSGDFFILQGVKDKKETNLLTALNKHVNQNSDSSAPQKKQNDKNPVKDLFFHQNALAGASSFTLEFPSYISRFTSYILPPLPLPPPEVSVA